MHTLDDLVDELVDRAVIKLLYFRNPHTACACHVGVAFDVYEKRAKVRFDFDGARVFTTHLVPLWR